MCLTNLLLKITELVKKLVSMSIANTVTGFVSLAKSANIVKQSLHECDRKFGAGVAQPKNTHVHNE